MKTLLPRNLLYFQDQNWVLLRHCYRKTLLPKNKVKIYPGNAIWKPHYPRTR
jgi:hypothetical protein